MAYKNTNYREQIDKEAYQYGDLADYEFDDREEFIPKSVVIQIIDEIESDINDINHKLEHINGLTEVDEIKKQVSELSTKLY
ncbi:hypothetical protein [Lachnospira eligens]|jgi:hypothetical protein|uniref:Uncharacterized protein n=2 Tax=root TaxID=1 RepID=A0A415MEB6_9FIRM|nr:hypothetical protein [Lachnospira eligens]RHA50545.1 hypothetical protein DW933_02965 [Lachnospira eligens]RHL71048.1 hypothetical protein DW007_02575 [Lachnospira eligens]DAE30560.1 MAG TPA: hypothetical protein [virus sp. ctiha2]